nr:MAG TPA: putative tail fiber protein [Bacteriophage sp.]
MPLKCKNMAEQDIKMNQFQVVTDAAYIYAEASNGSQVKIKKSDLLNAMFQKGTPVKDYNLNTEIGIYYINVSVNGTINGPSNSISYGILFVLKGLNNYIVQIACSVTGLLNVFIRTRTELAWSEWKSVNIT